MTAAVYITGIANERTTRGQLVVDRRFCALYALFLVLLFPAHESGHWLAYRWFDVPTRFTLNTVSPLVRGERRPQAEVAGPLVNLGFAVVALFVWRRTHRQGWAALALAASFIRLVIYAIVIAVAGVSGNAMTMGNDEPLAARLWHLPTLSILAVLALPLVAVTALILRDANRPWVAVAQFALVTLLVGTLVGNVLDPWLFPPR